MTNSKFQPELIVNADDFGLTPDTNRAVDELAGLGTISSTSVMANMSYAMDSAELADKHPRFGIGLHLNFTAGRPLTAGKSFIGEDGNFLLFNDLVRNTLRGQINHHEITREIEAQISRLQSFIGGRRIEHWNSHQGIHRYEPFYSAALAVCKAHDIHAMRGHRHYFVQPSTPFEARPPKLQRDGVRRIGTEIYYNIMTLRARRHFLLAKGLLTGKDVATLELLHWVADLGVPTPVAVWEIPCHPAISDAGLTEKERKIQREQEYRFFRSPAWLDSIASGHVRLTRFSSLSKD